MQFLKQIIQEPLERGCVFSALVGAESLYLMLRSNLKRVMPFWASLLPVLAGYALLDFGIHAALNRTSLEFVYPYLTTLLAGAGANVLLSVVFRGPDGKQTYSAQNMLLFASLTALLLMLSLETSQEASLPKVCTDATYLWLGYGLGVLTFWSLSQRLRRPLRSPAVCVVILYCIFAIVGAVLAGFAGKDF